MPNEKELTATSRRIAAVAIAKPRRGTSKHTVTVRVVYTDAAGESGVVAAAILEPARFADRKIDSVCAGPGGRIPAEIHLPRKKIHLRVRISIPNRLPHAKGGGARDKSAIFYLDNDNALKDIAKNAEGPTVIQRMAALILRRTRVLRILPFCERATSRINIAERPLGERPSHSSPLPSNTAQPN